MPQIETYKRNSPWTEEETALALELYLKHRPRVLDDSHAEVAQLSAELRALAEANGTIVSATFRNPVGVSMKLANLKAGDPEHRGKGLSHGSRIEAQVWSKYGTDPLLLATSAWEIRRKIKLPYALMEEEAEEFYPSVSRGPLPFIGSVEQQRIDGENSLYVFRLDGPVQSVFSQPIPHEMIVVKVGRSNDVQRRLSEMNAGFPSGLTIQWVQHFSHTYLTAMQAHNAEQNLLKNIHREKRSLGKEFALTSIKALKGHLEKLCVEQ